jgi:hypothetical protein
MTITPSNQDLTSITTKNCTTNNQKVFVFPNTTLPDEEDHFKETFNTISNIVQGLNTRKSSFGTASNASMISVNKRMTGNQPFSLSRSNSRRTRDIVQL